MLKLPQVSVPSALSLEELPKKRCPVLWRRQALCQGRWISPRIYLHRQLSRHHCGAGFPFLPVSGWGTSCHIPRIPHFLRQENRQPHIRYYNEGNLFSGQPYIHHDLFCRIDFKDAVTVNSSYTFSIICEGNIQDSIFPAIPFDTFLSICGVENR